MRDEGSHADVATLVDEEPDVHDAAGAPLPWLVRMCRAAARHLPASGAGVSLMTEDGTRGVVAASDARSEYLDELQFVVGEGPCLDAYSSRRPVLEPDLERSLQWPGYAEVVLEQGVRAVFAFPLQVGAARLGVMDVYRKAPGDMSDRAVRQALSFADLAVESLLDAQLAAADGTVGHDLAVAIEYRSEIYQAQGMVMVDLGVTLEEAMVRLRAYAYANGRRLGSVAHDVVTGRLVIGADPR